MKQQDIQESIKGVRREIDKRMHSLAHMRLWLSNPKRSGPQYTMDFINQNGPKLQAEVRKLKLIKIELIYLAGLKEFL